MIANPDQDVLRLSIAGFLFVEIQELLDLSEEALRSALSRVAEQIAPTAASKTSISLEDCLSLSYADGRYAELGVIPHG